VTNVAIALSLRPDHATEVKEIAFTGGGLGFGSIAATAELKVYRPGAQADKNPRRQPRLTQAGASCTEGLLLV
jgi:hypothetical protein